MANRVNSGTMGPPSMIGSHTMNVINGVPTPSMQSSMSMRLKSIGVTPGLVKTAYRPGCYEALDVATHNGTQSAFNYWWSMCLKNS